MKTYRHENTVYFYDPSAFCRSWTIYEIDPVTGYQVGAATHIYSKSQLKFAHPEFKFVPYVEIEYTPAPKNDGPITLFTLNLKK